MHAIGSRKADYCSLVLNFVIIFWSINSLFECCFVHHYQIQIQYILLKSTRSNWHGMKRDTQQINKRTCDSSNNLILLLQGYFQYSSVTSLCIPQLLHLLCNISDCDYTPVLVQLYFADQLVERCIYDHISCMHGCANFYYLLCEIFIVLNHATYRCQERRWLSKLLNAIETKKGL